MRCGFSPNAFQISPIVEADKLGGVCVNIGCIPTKALLHSAAMANSIRKEAKELGIEVGEVKTDYGVAMKRSRKVAEQNSKGAEFLMKKNKVTVIKGTGVLASATTVKVGDDVLTEAGVPHDRGTVWTTDAFFRETAAKVALRREQGARA